MNEIIEIPAQHPELLPGLDPTQRPEGEIIGAAAVTILAKVRDPDEDDDDRADWGHPGKGSKEAKEEQTEREAVDPDKPFGDYDLPLAA